LGGGGTFSSYLGRQEGKMLRIIFVAARETSVSCPTAVLIGRRSVVIGCHLFTLGAGPSLCTHVIWRAAPGFIPLLISMPGETMGSVRMITIASGEGLN
jgi:hypothetical protein